MSELVTQVVFALLGYMVFIVASYIFIRVVAFAVFKSYNEAITHVNMKNLFKTDKG